jgi:hypothetical protein
MYRFLKREHYTNRRVTHQAQEAGNCIALVRDYVTSVRDTIERLQIPPQNIVNMDETNVDFNSVAVHTFAPRGSRTVSIRGAGTSNRCTVALACSSTGVKLPPFVIYKGVPGPTGRISREFATLPYPVRLHYTVQRKGWMDEERMLLWVDKVWRPFVLNRGTTMLILDAFVVHSTARVKAAFDALGTHVEFIPAGYTGTLQVLDVGINKPFKDNIRNRFELFMSQEENQRPSRLNVAEWIDYSWQQITTETILNTWLRCMDATRAVTGRIIEGAPVAPVAPVEDEDDRSNNIEL